MRLRVAIGQRRRGGAVSATPVVIVPGWRNSGPGHWQTLWAQRLPVARRVEQDDWAKPARAA